MWSDFRENRIELVLIVNWTLGKREFEMPLFFCNFRQNGKG